MTFKCFQQNQQTIGSRLRSTQELTKHLNQVANTIYNLMVSFVRPSKSISVNLLTLSFLGINYNCVAADTVNAYLADSTINAANNRNRDYLKVLEGASVKADRTYTAASDDVYTTILDLRAEFIEKNKADYMVPTALFVSPLVMARLKEKNLILFKDNSPYGTFLEMEIIEAPDLRCDMIMMHASAMVSAIAYQAIEVFSSAPLGFPGGTAASGEIDYCNAPTEYVAGWAGKPILRVGTISGIDA